MKNGKYSSRKASHVKPLVLLLTLALVVGCAVGGTLAWLTANTDPVVNTFTVGNIDIDLNETTGEEYKMIPGYKIGKDPKVIVKADSEDCWLFVKVDESSNLDEYITYVVGGTTVSDDAMTAMVEGGWTQGDGTQIPQNVYYRHVEASDKNQVFGVIGYMNGENFVANKVLVKDTVTKDMMDAIKNGTVQNPTLTFTAYAVQYNESNNDPFTPAEAWAKVAP